MKTKKLSLLLLVFALLFSCVACGETEVPNNAEQAQSNFEEKVFVDDENCTFKITGVDADGIFGYTLNAYIENKTGKNLMFAWNDVSVNGFMCDPFWATSVQAGKKSVSDISFSETELAELGIETVETIEFTLSVYDEDDWMADHLVEETFTLNLAN